MRKIDDMRCGAGHYPNTTAVCSECWRAIEDAADSGDADAVIRAVADALRARGWED